MNIFRLVADLMHLLSIFILLHKIRKTRSCVGKLSAGLSLSRSSGGTQCRTRYLGISFKSQLLYTIVFLTRYLDLFTKFISVYNTVMKIFFIGSSVYILYLMKFKYKATYDANLDTFRIEYLLGASAVMGLAFPHKYTVMEVTSWVILGFFLPHFSNKKKLQVLWSFSIWLESVAILPQLFMLQRTGEAETITTHYLFALGIYRALYLVNWIYRYISDDHIYWIAWVAGLLQTALYSDFFYIYYTK